MVKIIISATHMGHIKLNNIIIIIIKTHGFDESEENLLAGKKEGRLYSDTAQKRRESIANANSINSTNGIISKFQILYLTYA